MILQDLRRGNIVRIPRWKKKRRRGKKGRRKSAGSNASAAAIVTDSTHHRSNNYNDRSSTKLASTSAATATAGAVATAGSAAMLPNLKTTGDTHNRISFESMRAQVENTILTPKPPSETKTKRGGSSGRPQTNRDKEKLKV